MSEENAAGEQMVEVEILGEQHVLRSQASPEYTRRVAEHVNRTAQEIRSESGIIELKKLAILTALAVTDQMFRLREGVERVHMHAERRAERLTGEIIGILDSDADG